MLIRDEGDRIDLDEGAVEQARNLDGRARGQVRAEAVGSSPQEFAEFLQAKMQEWSQVVRDAGIQPEQ